MSGALFAPGFLMSVAILFALNTVFNFAIALLVAKFLGPAEYGRFALASAVSIFLNSALFDWLRHSATRFYSQRTREEDPAVRATLDAVFAGVTALLGAGAVALILSGIDLPISGGLLALAVAASVASALFDYHTALIRARFLNGAYRRIVIAKHLAALVFTAGGAWWFGSAQMALTGLCLSVAFSLTTLRQDIADPGAGPSAAQWPKAAAFLGYGYPIVLASVIHQTIPLLNRAEVADSHGFAETGQYALAFDMGVKLVGAIGSTLDVLLFQLAVRAEETDGSGRAMEQVGRNVGLVFAVVLPTCLGFWLVLPSFEALIVPSDYRGPFAHYLTLFMPGLFAFALLQYAVAPIFQIGKRTTPLVLAALAAAAANGLMLAFAPAASDASPFAAAQSVAFITGFVALALMAAFTTPARPPLRDLAATLVACALMTGLLLPMRAMEPGALTLALQIGAGASACLVLYAAFNVGDLRRLVLQRLRPAPAG